MAQYRNQDSNGRNNSNKILNNKIRKQQIAKNNSNKSEKKSSKYFTFHQFRLHDIVIFKKNLKIHDKGVIRSFKSMKNTQYNGQKTRDKKTNDQPQNITQKTKD